MMRTGFAMFFSDFSIVLKFIFSILIAFKGNSAQLPRKKSAVTNGKLN
jgi:hypothetical protein